MIINEYKYSSLFQKATISRRFIASIIDILIILPVILLFIIIVIRINDIIQYMFTLSIFVILINIYIFIVYKIFNASIGEKIMSLKLIKVTNEAITIKNIIIRMFIPFCLNILNAIRIFLENTYKFQNDKLFLQINNIINENIILEGENLEVMRFYFENSKNNPIYNPIYIIIGIIIILYPIIRIIIFFKKSRYRSIDDIISNTVLVKINNSANVA